MRIPGLPGAAETTFRTRDALLVSLDRLVEEVCAELAEAGMVVAPPMAKSAIQAARAAIMSEPEQDEQGIVTLVQARLRRERILLPAPMVGEMLRRYLRKVVELDVTEITDL
jgi:hypothetical protein